MKLILHKTIKLIYLAILFVIIINNHIFYAKSININGIKAEINIETTKESVVKGVNIKDNNKNDFSTTEYDKDEKETNDKYVKVELNIRNENPYEDANVIIEEITPTNFRQLESRRVDKIINTKISPRTNKTFNYNYRYHNSIFTEQYNSIKYDDDGNIIDIKGSTTDDINSDYNINDSNINRYKEDNPEEDLKKGAIDILIFILTFIGCVLLFYVFRMFYKAVKSNDDSFFNDDYDKLNQMIIFLVVSIVFGLISYNNKVIADKKYDVQIYEYGKSYEKVIYDAVDFNGRLYRFPYKITISFDSTYEITDEDYEKDTDGDLLVDAFEYQYMTDKNNVDTDNDGLSDYIEVMLLDYNPLSDDTFNDGIKDGDRDYDTDKLTNIEEIKYGTDLFNIDTDYDTLTDYDEINVHNTDPLNIDTDYDLLIDPDELKLSLDPTNPRTDGITLDSERKIEQEYTMTNVPEELREGDIFIKNIKGSVSGLIDNNIKIQTHLDEVIYNSKSTKDIIFKAEINNDDDIEITIDANKIADRVKYLVIVKYENCEFYPIETICNEDNELIANINSGIYTIIDSDLLLRELNIYNNDYTP